MQCKAVNGLSCGDDMWEWNWDDAGLVFLAFEFGQNFKGRVNKAKAPSRDPRSRSLWQQQSFSNAQAQLHIGGLYSCLCWPAHINAQRLVSSI
jgi:hypothetical protein